MTAEAADTSPEAMVTPSLLRRMAAFLYEGVLLFGVIFASGLVYAALTRQRHALQGHTGLQTLTFVVLAIYFTAFWTRGGQTLAMRAWHVRLVTARGQSVGLARALMRYLLCWLWFVPALTAAHLAGLHSTLEIFGLMAAGVVAYALLAFAHPQRQFWHDAACGTRLVTWRAQSRA
jgi:uncharacterized RDD family membrane protein YckC